jgi:pimeloyl-ACP methyl ester carboxylesterase
MILVFVPAFGCDAALYSPQIDALSEVANLQFIVPKSDRYDKMVDELLTQVDGDFAILGTSMGGRLALEVALAAPDRVEALCVIGAGAGAVADPVAGQKRSARIRDGERDQVIEEMSRMVAHEEGPRGIATRKAFVEMGQRMDVAQLARQSDALFKRVDRWEQVASIACPTLCLWGCYDKFSPAADGARLAEAVQDGSYVELPECGHFPTLEYPDESNDAILTWLEDADLI